ncbi:MAG: TlpA family protein disulfide reductase [Prevotella shahii]|jgi:thioredoxin family protein|uniref:TlpA family protein disulfide reductase n=1 Tax=Hoylesella shahii TaxID=228603 RepID=UPI001CB30479|nr:TlpA disulfide reductase family protein [Hoylesella shahii]MBF1569384.1 TlpA family protein disulfide reductase [Hoylesella shahii]MBF1576559.1 TlpA family protein disulfide reductase [Hoylesella shahii]
MTKTIFSALALATVLAFASCNCKKNGECAKAQAEQQVADTTNATTQGEAQANDGSKFIDFTVPALDGKQVKLADVVAKNKITMVDFWASWCGPCRMEMPNVVEAYKQFHNKGLEIVGVSLDESKEDWETAVKDMGMNWIQTSDLKGWECEAARLYGVRGIPACVLINQKGEIVGRDLRAEELHARLAELLK